MSKSRIVRASRAACCVGVFILVIGCSYTRMSRIVNVPGQTFDGRWGLIDFRDSVYYPVVALIEGNNPYETPTHMARYPVAQPFVLYSPLTLFVHLPFGLLPHHLAQQSHFVLALILTTVLAYFTLLVCGRDPTVASVCLLSSLILVSRPGHWNLMLGQTTVKLVLASYVALAFSSRSVVLSGLGLSIATLKPTFGLPLVILMVFQRRWRPVFTGLAVALSGVLVATAILVRSAGGVGELIESVWDGYHGVTSEEWIDPLIAPARIDAVAIIARLTGYTFSFLEQIVILLAVVAVAGAVLVRVQKCASGREATLFSVSVACLAILLASYNQIYSGLLLVLPMTALVLGCWAPPSFHVPPFVRPVLILLLSIPMVNYISTFTALQYLNPGPTLRLLIISANGMALLSAFALYIITAFRQPFAHRGGEGHNDLEDNASSPRFSRTTDREHALQILSNGSVVFSSPQLNSTSLAPLGAHKKYCE